MTEEIQRNLRKREQGMNKDNEKKWKWTEELRNEERESDDQRKRHRINMLVKKDINKRNFGELKTEN